MYRRCELWSLSIGVALQALSFASGFQKPVASFQKLSGCEPLSWKLRLGAERLVTNLVDPASSHMLVSKIKPCMSQYKLLYGETANGSLKQL